MEKITDTKSLGPLIRQERRQQGLTQEQLAGAIGVGVRFLRELEAGKESCQIGGASLTPSPVIATDSPFA
ncbi:helix-turn-helix domain-containing protein [Ensifer adhaerens]|uniref:helix-turn-helix domain-containing protein n=1 Tax=Ensifer canadensis TaxID=555315 RepID=UPI00148FD736|nr:helix-turn-helix domain-containing protein [Ensifer canadensis]NOV20879.1 helix-turn-helix domain-containing protein [Ensifer canadensis]